MEKVRILEIKESVFADNDRQADQLRARLKEKGVFLMNLMSSPGSGKTTTLKKTIEALKNDFRIGVMEADIDSDVDALAIAETGAKALFAGGADTAHMPTTELAAEDFDEEGNIDLISLLVKSALVTTRSEGRRAIEQGGVSVDGEKVLDIKHVLSKDVLTGDGVVLKRGKKKFNKIFVK